MKKFLIAAATACVIASASAALGQSGRVGWDGTWVGGWDRGAGVQLVFVGEELMVFFWRDDYKDVVRSAASPDGRGKTFAWNGGDAILTRTPGGGVQLVVRERGRSEVSIPLKRDGG